MPILSRVVLRGRCRRCGARIPPDESWIEAAGAMAGAAALLAGGAGAPWILLCGWLLLLLAAIDHFHGILPDRLNIALLVLGMLALIFDPGAPAPLDGLIGALAGAGVFALLAAAYHRLRGRAGLGGGDVKLMGALGVWVGLAGLAWVVLLAATGALLAALAVSRGRFDGGHAIRFGPWLAGAGFVVLLAGRY